MATLIETLSNPATFTYEVSAQSGGVDTFRRLFLAPGAALVGAVAVPGASIVDVDPASDVIAVDAEAGDSVGVAVYYTDDYLAATPAIYSITSQSTPGAFAVQATTGVVSVADPALLDSAARPTETITIRATKSGTSTYTERTYPVSVTA